MPANTMSLREAAAIFRAYPEGECRVEGCLAEESRYRLCALHYMTWRSLDPQPGEMQDLPMPVDHCHATGRVRGILCYGCNGAIGVLGDSIEVLESAQRYLLKGRDVISQTWAGVGA